MTHAPRTKVLSSDVPGKVHYILALDNSTSMHHGGRVPLHDGSSRTIWIENCCESLDSDDKRRPHGRSSNECLFQQTRSAVLQFAKYLHQHAPETSVVTVMTFNHDCALAVKEQSVRTANDVDDLERKLRQTDKFGGTTDFNKPLETACKF